MKSGIFVTQSIYLFSIDFFGHQRRLGVKNPDFSSQGLIDLSVSNGCHTALSFLATIPSTIFQVIIIN
ncbi:hypothetical protein SAMN03080598_03676 [Algoriphagus boritolerans DSM 17298 = JCM 18970]|uniref:Uncharacterized protein n=1 Tax=Algoriphagus boritolerans DSM 17298 = JCM 18970 TaxID=1120964 RepID=A0A1H5ZQI9_9BACT|nr:hypothetical protein SAMN03080598_03676 [Algoriphagus boritolerans DSM 17298 = JCM 18970]